MALTKYANVEEILEVKSSKNRLQVLPGDDPSDGLAKFAALNDNLEEGNGYLYVRCRAISSRVNKNNDGWPSEELAAAYKSFQGRPIFVDHNNENPDRTRGVIISSQLHREEDDKKSALDSYYSTAPDNHKPPTWIELLLEIDAKTYPKLADAIRDGHIDAVSMGANIEKSVCSVCSNEAATPSEYCSHIKQKGVTFEIESASGEKVRKKAYEDCHGVNFFEISAVFDPADPSALISEKKGKVEKTAALPADAFIEPLDSDNESSDDKNYEPQDDQVTAPQQVDTLRDETLCPNCHADHLRTDPDGIERCSTCGFVQQPEPLNNPDLGTAKDTDLRQMNEDNNNEEGDLSVPVSNEDDASNITFEPMSGVSPVNRTTKNVIPRQGIDEMNWKVKLETTSREIADKVLPAKAASADTTIRYADGIGFGTHVAFKKAGIEATVRYPVDGDNETTIPGNPLKDFMLVNRAMKALGADTPRAIPVRVTSTNLDDALEIIHEGGLDGRVAAKREQKKQALLPGDKKATDEPKNVKVISDQLKPVESKLMELMERVSSLGDTMEKDADRRHIKREEREEDGAIVRSEEIVEESGDGPEETYEEPTAEESTEETPEAETEEVTEDEREPVAAHVDPESRLLSIFSLADDLVELGIVAKEEKMAFVAKLEQETEEEIEGRKRMLAAVKEAGLTKSARKIAGTGLNRIPRLSHNASVVSNSNGSLDSIPDEAIFG